MDKFNDEEFQKKYLKYRYTYAYAQNSASAYAPQNACDERGSKKY